MNEKIDEIFHSYKEDLKKIDANLLKFLDLHPYQTKRTEFKQQYTPKKKSIKSDEELNELKDTQIDLLKKWLNSEIHTINSHLISNIKTANLIISNIDIFLESPMFVFDEKICKNSFISHYLGIKLLHKPRVSEKYREEKERFLKNNDSSESFYNRVLASRILEKTLNKLNKLYSKLSSSYLISYEDIFIPLIEKLSEKPNLRILLKKMNQINDYLLFREMYKHCSIPEIPFSEFIKKGKQEIIDILISKYPIINYDETTIKKLNNEDEFDQDLIFPQIKPNGDLHCSGYKTYIDPDLFSLYQGDEDYLEDSDLWILILSFTLPPPVCSIYYICKNRQFSHLKKYYLEENEKHLIKDTMNFLFESLENTEELSKDKISNPEFFTKIFLSKRTDQTKSPQQNILEHAFFLILRKFFYNECYLNRTDLPYNFSFTSNDSVSFLSNIRLCNRSLARQSRNLLQDPTTRIQIDVLNSGSEELCISSKVWYFEEDPKTGLNSHSLFAVDKQILNSKRSEKRRDMLSREHQVSKIGAYSKIRSDFLNDEDLSKSKGTKIAGLIRKPVSLKSNNNEFTPSTPPNNNPSLGEAFYFSSLAYLLFGVEAMRNPSMLVLNHMLLDLLRNEHIRADQIFGGSGCPKISGRESPFIFGLMPTAPKTVTARSRELNNLYGRYMPFPYIYPGDLSRNADGQPTNKDDTTNVKVTLNHLMYRESLVMQMWFASRGYNLDDMELQKIVSVIEDAYSEWWDFNNDDNPGSTNHNTPSFNKS